MKFERVLLLGVVALVAGIVGAVVLTINFVLHAAAVDDGEERLRLSQELFVKLQEYRASTMRGEARVLADEPRLRAVMATDEITAETAFEVASELRLAIGSDLFVVTDDEGTVLADVADEGAGGDDL